MTFLKIIVFVFAVLLRGESGCEIIQLRGFFGAKNFVSVGEILIFADGRSGITRC